MNGFCHGHWQAQHGQLGGEGDGQDHGVPNFFAIEYKKIFRLFFDCEADLEVLILFVSKSVVRQEASQTIDHIVYFYFLLSGEQSRSCSISRF